MSSPGVNFGPDVVAYLAAHGGALTLRGSPRHGCCGGGAVLPVAEARTPDDSSNFTRWQQDGVTVYAEASLLPQLPLTVRLESLLGFKRLFVDGAESRPRG